MQTGQDNLGGAGFTTADLPELTKRALGLLDELFKMPDGPESAEKFEEFIDVALLMGSIEPEG